MFDPGKPRRFKGAPKILHRRHRGRPRSRATPRADAVDAFVLCTRCGLLADDDDQPCRECAAREFLDLRNASHREAAIKFEDDLVALADAHAGRHFLTVSSWSIAGLAIGVGAMALIVPPFAMLVGGTLATAFGGTAHAFHHRRSLLARPLRWRGPTSTTPAGPDEAWSHLEGIAQTPDRLLRAPLSGKPCLAYRFEVTIPRWRGRPIVVLEEHESVALELAGQPIEAGRLILDEPTVATPVRALVDPGQRLERQLLARGISLARRDYCLREALVEPGDALEIRHLDAPSRALVGRRSAGLPTRQHAGPRLNRR